MGNDRERFGDFDEGLPVYEGRMVDQFDYRAKAYRSGRGRAAVWEKLPFGDPGKVIGAQWHLPVEKIPGKVGDRTQRYRVGWCDVTSPNPARTLVAALIPPDTICGDKVPTLDFPASYEWAYLPWLAVANSFCVDYLARKRVSLKMSMNVLDSLPFPRLQIDDPVNVRLSRLALGLTCTGPEMTAYWNAASSRGWCEAVQGKTTPPGFIEPVSRARARAEIDAIVARELFDLSVDQLATVLDTFEGLERREQKACGEFETKRLVLEHYRALDAAGNVENFPSILPS
jgi:hypothetical protein